MDPLALIEAHADELRALGAQRIGVFGSFARGEATAESDVDIYLEFAKGRKSYDNFYATYELLQGFFGRSIDLVTDGSLSERKAKIILPTVRYVSLVGESVMRDLPPALVEEYKDSSRPQWRRSLPSIDSTPLPHPCLPERSRPA